MALSASAGGALVSAAATDAWATARDGALKLFGRGGVNRQKLVGEWLDQDAAAVAAAEPSDRAALRLELLPVWRTRLADLLAEYPEAADELRAWAARLRVQIPPAEQAWTQTNTARERGVVFAVQRGNQYVRHLPGESSSPSPDQQGPTLARPAGDDIGQHAN